MDFDGAVSGEFRLKVQGMYVCMYVCNMVLVCQMVNMSLKYLVIVNLTCYVDGIAGLPSSTRRLGKPGKKKWQQGEAKKMNKTDFYEKYVSQRNMFE